MANKRDLKKDVTNLTLNVLSDCILYIELYPESEAEKFNNIMNGVVDLEVETRKKINAAKGLKGKELKAHYKELKEAYFGGVTGFFSEVDEMFSSKEK